MFRRSFFQGALAAMTAWFFGKRAAAAPLSPPLEQRHRHDADPPVRFTRVRTYRYDAKDRVTQIIHGPG